MIGAEAVKKPEEKDGSSEQHGRSDCIKRPRVYLASRTVHVTGTFCGT